MAKPKVLAAERGDTASREWMKQVGLWMAEFDAPKKPARQRGPSVRSMSRLQAETLVPPYPVAFISITDVNSPEAALPDHRFVRAVLRLSFDDFSVVEDGFVNFDRQMARRILDFVTEQKSQVRAILVHCEMGISRSAAVAIALSQIHDLPISHRNRNDIWPNRLVLQVIAEEAKQ